MHVPPRAGCGAAAVVACWIVERSIDSWLRDGHRDESLATRQSHEVHLNDFDSTGFHAVVTWSVQSAVGRTCAVPRATTRVTASTYTCDSDRSAASKPAASSRCCCVTPPGAVWCLFLTLKFMSWPLPFSYSWWCTVQVGSDWMVG